MSKGDQYVSRDYRSLHGAGDLKYFMVKYKESDLAIGIDQEIYTDSLIHFCRQKLITIRHDIENYIDCVPEFKESLVPIAPVAEAPRVVLNMITAAALAGVGPMAAVAGAVAEYLASELNEASNIIIENGGDIFIRTSKIRTVAVFAGESAFSNRIGIQVYPEETPLGVCTSSGTVGPSLSFGRADAVVIKSRSAALADAAATGAANLVQNEKDLMKAIEYAQNIKGITGILAIKDNVLSAWGDIEIVKI